MRLDKYLHDQQFGTRSEIKLLIKQKRVQVNGETVKSFNANIDPSEDEIAVDGQSVSNQTEFFYLLNKPSGVITATKDEHDRTVMDLLEPSDFRTDLFPVGRLDKDTTGVLLITNDGELAHQLLRPKKHVQKTYLANLTGELTKSELGQLTGEMVLKNGDHVQADEAQFRNNDHSALMLTIHEGKYHQVKRMIGALGQRVATLHRQSFGNLTDDNLEVGQYRALSEKEIHQLRELVER